MHRYRLTRRFMLPEEAIEPADDRGSAALSLLLIACTDAVLDETLLRSEAVRSARILRTRGNCIAGTGVDPALPALIERLAAEKRITELVLCGHSGCRHFAPASFAQADAGATGSENWYERSLRRMTEFQAGIENAKANVIHQLSILNRLTCVERGDLRISGSFYLCESGTTLVYDESSRRFRLAMPKEVDSTRHLD